MKLKIFITIKIIFIGLLLLLGCSNVPLDIDELDYFNKNNNLSLREKETIFPYHDYMINSINIEGITKDEVKWLLSVLDLLRVVINSDAFEEEMLKTGFVAGLNISSPIPEYNVSSGGKLDSKRMLEVVRSGPLDIWISYNTQYRSVYHHYGTADFDSLEHFTSTVHNLGDVVLSKNYVFSGDINHKIYTASLLLSSMMYRQGFNVGSARKIADPFEKAAANTIVQQNYAKFSPYHEQKFDYLVKRGL